MSVIRLRRKLENLLEVYYEPGLKPADKNNLIKKINDLEKQLNIPLTPKEIINKKGKTKKDYTVVVENKKETLDKHVLENSSDDMYLERYRYNKEVKETINSILSEEEKKYLDDFEKWYKQVEDKAKKIVRNKKIFPITEINDKTKDRVMEILDLLDKGFSVLQISDHFGLTTDAITYYIRNYFEQEYEVVNYDDFKEYNNSRGYEIWKGLTPQILIEKLKSGIPRKEIEAEYNISQGHLSKLYKNFVEKKYKLKKEYEEFI